MIKSLWFIIKLAVVIGVAVWIADHPGMVTVQWLDYTISVHIALALILLLVVIVIASYIGRTLSFFRKLPAIWDRYNYIKGTRKGYENLTLGYAALAGGDLAKAQKYLNKADSKIPNDYDPSLLLTLGAQIAKEKGDDHKRRQLLARLAERDKTGVMGLRGILADLMEKGEYCEAQAFLDHYLPKYRHKPWLMKFRYALALASDDWEEAQSLLEKSGMKKVKDKLEIQSDLVALLILRADKDLETGDAPNAIARLKYALRLDRIFIPAVTRLATIYIDIDKLSAARSLLNRTWTKNPHPDLVYLFDRLHSKRSKKSAATRIKTFQRLVDKAPHAAEGYVALAQVAMEEKAWDTARAALERAEEKAPTKRVYLQWADYELAVNEDQIAVNTYLRKAGEAPPEKRWVCRKTGHVYQRWSPIARPHGAFNTIIWTTPPRTDVKPVLAPVEDNNNDTWENDARLRLTT